VKIPFPAFTFIWFSPLFSTKDRRPFLRDKPARNALHSYLGGVSKQLDCPPLLVGAVEDHVHVLARFGAHPHAGLNRSTFRMTFRNCFWTGNPSDK